MIEQALVAFLKADPQVANLSGGRVWKNKAPQRKGVPPPLVDPGIYPHLVYHRIGTRRVQSNSGPTGLCRAHLQLDALALLGGDASALADAIRNAKGGSVGLPNAGNAGRLDGFAGTMGAFSVQGCWVSDDRDEYIPPFHADDVGVAQVSVDVVIWFGEVLS